MEGIERRIELGSLATSVFVFHPEATFTNDAASSWYFQGIIENRIFPRIAVLLRGKMDIVRIFNIAYTEDFSLWISLQLRGLISRKYYPFTGPFAHNLPKIPLPGEKTLFGFPAKSINRYSSSFSPPSYKFLLFSSHLPLNQTKTRQEGRDSRLFRGLDNSQPPLQETIRRTEERHGRGRRGPARMQITSEAVIPEVGRSVALASCARCKDKSPGETSTRWESNSVSLRSRRRIQVGPPPPFRFLADATLNPPPPVIELGFYTTLRRYTWNTVKTTRSVYTVTRKRN